MMNNTVKMLNFLSFNVEKYCEMLFIFNFDI